MAKISELTDGGSLQPTDTLIAVRSGSNVKVVNDTLNVTTLNPDQINMGDNEQIRMGNSQDLLIYHDGTNSRINDNGTGNLRLQTGGNTKLEVTSTGIDVTGTVTATSSTDSTITIKSTKDGTWTADEVLGKIDFYGSDSSGEGAATKIRLAAESKDTFGAAFDFEVKTSDGTNGLAKAATFFHNQDFKLYNGENTKLFWDASAESLCLNNFSSTARLVVGGTRNDATIELLQLESASDWANGDALGSLVFRTADPSGAGSGIKGSIRYGTTGSTGSDTYMAFNVAGTGVGTNDTERLRIDSSGRVGIGTSAMSSYNANWNDLVIDGGTSSGLTVVSATTGIGTLAFADGTTGNEQYRGYLQYSHNNDELSIGVAGALAATIDSSGNLLVGTTNINPSQNAVEGIALSAGSYGGYFSAARSGGVVAQFARLTNDGAILDFRNASASVGSIGTLNGNVTIGTGDTGVQFNQDTNAVIPHNISTGANVDATIDLGYSSGGTNRRFKDLYLSGNVEMIHSSSGSIQMKRYDSTININNHLGQIVFGGSEDGGTTVNNSASIVALSSQNHTSTASGGYLTFNTTTDNTTTLTERMRITSAGNVGIGTSTNLANGTLNVESNGTSVLQARSDTAGVNDGDTTLTALRAVNSTAAKWANTNYYAYSHKWGIGSGASSNSAMTLDASGNLLVGTTDTDPSNNTTGTGVTISSDGRVFTGGASASQFNRIGSDGSVINLRRDGTTVGSISVTASATAYNTSSDQRLKENIVDAPSASDDIDAIQVRSFDWKADGSHQKYGMVAQELVTVAPEAVSQPEDPDEMMGVDYSKLVPMLIKEVQQLRARVAQLEGAN